MENRPGWGRLAVLGAAAVGVGALLYMMRRKDPEDAAQPEEAPRTAPAAATGAAPAASSGARTDAAAAAPAPEKPSDMAAEATALDLRAKATVAYKVRSLLAFHADGGGGVRADGAAQGHEFETARALFTEAAGLSATPAEAAACHMNVANCFTVEKRWEEVADSCSDLNASGNMP